MAATGAAEAPEQGNGLGSREGEIEAGDRAAGWNAAHANQRLPINRIAAGQYRFELRGLDLAGEAQILGGIADPFPDDLPLAGVVVLSAFRDLVEVVTLLSFAELADREHSTGYVRGERRMHRSLNKVIVREGGCCWLLGLRLGRLLMAVQPP
jgi:hypothetical protein